MVNVSYTDTSGDLVYFPDDGSDQVIYNLGDMAWSESHRSPSWQWLSFPH